MLRRDRIPTAKDRQVPDQDVDALILRIRRLAAHRGYDRSALVSPMLKRLIPLYKTPGGPAAEAAELRKRLAEVSLDAGTIVYLTETTEAELDFARLRLT